MSTSSGIATAREAHSHPFLVKELVGDSHHDPEGGSSWLEHTSFKAWRITATSQDVRMGLTSWESGHRCLEVKTSDKGSVKMDYSRSRVKTAHLPWSRHCHSQRFVSVWGSIIFNCFCLVFEPFINIILADFLCVCVFVVVLVCLLRFLFWIWCECVKLMTGKEWREIACFLFYAYAAWNVSAYNLHLIFL